MAKIKFQERVLGSVFVIIFLIVMMKLFLWLPDSAIFEGGISSIFNVAIIVLMVGGLFLTKRFIDEIQK